MTATKGFLPYSVPSEMSNHESVAFDCKDEGPYTGTSDGRILKWQGSKHGWKEFAFTLPFGYEVFF